MSDNEYIMGLTLVALFGGYIIYLQWERARKDWPPWRKVKRVGDVIDVAPLRPRLEALRRDYSAAAHAHARRISARETLVMAARRKLGQLPFFRGHLPPRHDEHHTA